MIKPLEHFIFQVNAFIKAAGISRKEFAKAAGISAPYLTQLLKGRNKNPGIEHLAAIARVLGRDLGYMLTLPGDWRADHDLRECHRRIGEALKITDPPIRNGKDSSRD